MNQDFPAAREPAGRIGVLDIGSNSIRLVVFDGLARAPFAIFNEKVLCGLGRGLESSGRLSLEGMAVALENIGRFVAVARAMAVGDLAVLATAAVRDASNGTSFVAEIERRFAIMVRIVSGGEEARLSALGVLAAEPQADGIVADLGGGSLEVVDVAGGRIGPQATLPLGPLRLADLAEAKRKQLRQVIDGRLAEVGWLPTGAGRPLYAVGGAWRSLARAHMAATGYPLHVIHNYAIERHAAEAFLLRVQRRDKAGGRNGLKDLPGVSRRRLEGLPYAAAVLERLLAATRASALVFSAQGLREGCLFDRLSPREQAEDPLISACRAIAREAGRFPEHGAEIEHFVAPLFAAPDPAAGRLMRAACLLSDIAWMEHPDYRAEHAFWRILRLPVVGIDHPGRARLALAVAARYAGDDPMGFTASADRLLDPAARRQATTLGLALRLAHTFTGGAAGVLSDCALSLAGGRLTLTMAGGRHALIGDVVRRRLDALGRALGAETRIE